MVVKGRAKEKKMNIWQGSNACWGRVECVDKGGNRGHVSLAIKVERGRSEAWPLWELDGR